MKLQCDFKAKGKSIHSIWVGVCVKRIDRLSKSAELFEMKTIFITGVSTGFGFLTTQKLLDQGYRVIAALRGGEERGRTLFTNYLSHIDRNQLIFVSVDLSSSADLNRALDQVVKHLGAEGLDVVINNAGYGLLGPIEIQDESQVRLQFETNFFAPFTIVQRLLPHLRKSKGRILNLSSLVGFNVFPFYGTYAASKHALDALSEGLYYDLKEFQIQVCAIQPGGFKTNFSPNVKIGRDDHPQRSIYETRIQRFKKFLSFVENKIEKDPKIVVQKILKLCTQEKIPLRVQVGSDSWFNWVICKISPDQWRVQIQDWLYRRFFF